MRSILIALQDGDVSIDGALGALTAALGDVEPTSGYMRGISDVAVFLESMQLRIKGLGEAIRLVRQFEAGRDTAALGDVEPLEDALSSLLAGGLSIEITAYPGDVYVVIRDVDEITTNSPWPDPVATAEGPTIDAAIRAAVANAKGGE